MCQFLLIPILIAISFFIPMSQAEEPVIEDLSWRPQDPTIQDSLNVTLTLSREVDSVDIWYCVGGICVNSVQMSVDTTGLVYSHHYLNGTFENATADFHIDIYYDITEKITHEFHITFRAVPENLVINEIDPDVGDPISSKPGQIFSVSGNCSYDVVSFNPPTGVANLSVVGSETLRNTTELDSSGSFNLGLALSSAGTYIINLTIIESSYNLTAFAQWTVDVSPWDRPLITISTDHNYDPMDAPPTPQGHTFYENGTVNMTYLISNAKTGAANNTKVRLTL